ncbi:MAG: heavy-metal-associated domain-containing protein [Desulfomonile tiedjei]|uniref:Heavy-metal-associated domain-containing protein n=1 Tax=Desulfomonile tiedjei TaxID=2358 RepID=A0A9D6V6L8_9BACT|nr:heavy-metal-associated domain-containing protein [Desulfomonile tiedjei]
MNTTIKIQGMSCNHCVMAVTKALSKIEGISDVKVDLAKGEASFERAESVILDKVKKQIEEEGYSVG